MLQELRISDLGVIDEAVLEPHPGFTVVTGETGAGKTMVVTALGLITGGRGDAGKVRAGTDRASRGDPLASAVDPSPDRRRAATVNSAGGRFDEDGTRHRGPDRRRRRTVPRARRRSGRAAGAPCPSSTDPLIAVHGQSEAISLLRPAQQRAVLDRFAGLTRGAPIYRELRSRWQRLAADLADRRARARERAQREQLLRLGLAEIEARRARIPGRTASWSTRCAGWRTSTGCGRPPSRGAPTP